MVLQKGIYFFLMPLYTAFLNPSDYGILGVVTSVSSFLAVFITLGLEAAAARFYYKNNKSEEYSRMLYGNVALIILSNSVIWGSLFIAAHGFFIDPIVGKIDFFPYVLIGILNVIVMPMYLLYQNYLQTRQDGVNYGINSISCFIIQVLLTVVSLAVFKLGVLGVLLSQLITSLLFFCYVIIKFVRKLNLTPQRHILKDCFTYSLPLLPHTLANWSNGTLDKLLVNGIRSQADAGMYNLGQQYGSVMSFAANAINQAYVPWFYEKVTKGNSGINEIRMVSNIVIRLICIAAIVFSLFSKEILGVMISNPEYDGVWKIIPCIVFAYVFQSIYFFFVNVLFLKDTKVVFPITITAVAVNILLNLLLIPNYGYVGSAVACLLTYFTKSVIALMISTYKNKIIRFNWLSMYVFAILSLTISASSILLKDYSLFMSLLVKFSLFLVIIIITGFKYYKIVISTYKTYVSNKYLS